MCDEQTQTNEMRWIPSPCTLSSSGHVFADAGGSKEVTRIAARTPFYHTHCSNTSCVKVTLVKDYNCMNCAFHEAAVESQSQLSYSPWALPTNLLPGST